jgi:hypothetical protein
LIAGAIPRSLAMISSNVISTTSLMARYYSVFQFTRTIVASPEAAWFETREDALLTMRV